ncbi:MAG TPA: hypothetical protein DCQ06_02410 [Myxococcales bacterium]|nr:hypothetical protein [Myxococcales bacterium]
MDTCDPQTNACKYTGVNDGKACDADGNGCTLNDECKAGKCVAGTTVTCMLADKPCDVFKCVSTSASSHQCKLSLKPGCVAGTRTAVADADVWKYNTNSNYGSKTSMIVDRGNQYVYIKFDLKDIPKTAKLVGATFSVTAYTGYAWGGDGNVYTTLVDNDNWSEKSITWGNKPAATGDSLGSWWLWYNNNTLVKTVSVNTPKFLQTVQEQIAKDGVLSLRLHSPGYKTVYRSRE